MRSAVSWAERTPLFLAQRFSREVEGTRVCRSAMKSADYLKVATLASLHIAHT
jgi:hypothetical protein